MTMSLDKIAKVYQVKSKTLYPYKNFKDESSYNNKLDDVSIEDFRSWLTAKLPTQADVDNFNNSNSKKTAKELTVEYMDNDVRILEHCFNLYVKLNIDIYKLNHLIYFSLPGFNFDCFLKLSEFELETLQDEQMLKEFISAMRGGICDVMGNRYIKIQSQSRSLNYSNRSIWYLDANNLYGYALMQKPPYNDFEYSNATLERS